MNSMSNKGMENCNTGVKQLIRPCQKYWTVVSPLSKPMSKRFEIMANPDTDRNDDTDIRGVSLRILDLVCQSVRRGALIPVENTG